MFRTLEEAIQDMEQSKREVEARIKARAQEVFQEMAEKEGNEAESLRIPAVPLRTKTPRFQVKGRTIYSSGSRSSRK